MKTKAIVLFAVCMTIFCCSKTKDDPVIPVTAVEVSPSTLEMDINEKKTLSVVITPSDATDKEISWSSSSSSIVSVSESGEVTAISPGIATVVVQCGAMKGVCSITVRDPFIPVSSITINPSSVRIPAGRKLDLSVAIEPSDATDKSVSWTSDNPSVATIENGTLTAVSEGTATISASSGEIKAICQVTVLAESPTATEAWYTSWTDKEITPNKEYPFGDSEIVSNKYENGKGVIALSSIPEELSEGAFMGVSELKTMSLPEGLKSIGKSAFENCFSLNSIILQEGLESIGDHSFYRCTSLKVAEFPLTLKTIGKYSFGYCLSLEEIVIPESVTSIDEFAFFNCDGLKRIVLKSETPPELGFRAFDETGSCEIIVPASAVDKYKKSERWVSYSSRIKAQ
ncbi:MAG: leucine-rich repeat protein [Bacteroidales bacterium]|nr:leucine-rich repeat protein [Bacteroidales bacterium]